MRPLGENEGNDYLPIDSLVNLYTLVTDQYRSKFFLLMMEDKMDTITGAGSMIGLEWLIISAYGHFGAARKRTKTRQLSR